MHLFFLFNQEPMEILEPHAVVGVDSGGGDSSEASIGCEAEKRVRQGACGSQGASFGGMTKAEATVGWRSSSPAGGAAA